MKEPSNKELARTGSLLRRDVLTMVHLAADGHPGPALSAADIVAVLYFRVPRIDPANPGWPLRDRFILSKGHSCPVVYAALARRGYFSPEVLPTLRSLGPILQGHPVMGKTPGIDMTTGSLGHGLAVGAGMALAGRMLKQDYHVFVVTGDGELNEGIVWEAAQSAANQKLGRLIIDSELLIVNLILWDGVVAPRKRWVARRAERKTLAIAGTGEALRWAGTSGRAAKGYVPAFCLMQ